MVTIRRYMLASYPFDLFFIIPYCVNFIHTNKEGYSGMLSSFLIVIYSRFWRLLSLTSRKPMVIP